MKNDPAESWKDCRQGVDDRAVPKQAATADPWDDTRQEIDDLASLRDDWDGEGAKAPSKELIDSVNDLLPIIRQVGIEEPPRVSVGPNGTVVLSWHNRRHYFEINVVEPYRVRWMMALSKARPEHGDQVNPRLFQMLQLTLSM